MSARRGSETLALLGLRCSGKTTVGRALARALGVAFVDLDERTLELGRNAGWQADSAGELLLRAGPADFRELESAALRRVLEASPRLVLATGGGVVERPDNRAWLARTARCIYLSVPNEVLAARLAADPTERPALLGGDPAQEPAQEIESLRARREPYYRDLAEIVLERGTEPPATLVEHIRQALAAVPA
jgi:shikimate kinase